MLQSTGSQRVRHDLATKQITMKNSLVVSRVEGWGVCEGSPEGGLGS